MEMESSRRSAMDRSREPGFKKPRLTEDAERDRGSNGAPPDRDRLVPRPATSGGSQSLHVPRFRASERERDEREESVRGGGSYQQQQELVTQYKTALVELTFNSKPIITNLTIIAGENLHAAKGIANTICANVLEVPSEQKLPSLYLLDSIVKNIGRDYIKHFAQRLPEVFCKAYKQVDSSIHPGMRHLFGTWKGVFPPACLQIIEKELGFPPVVNGSSGTASRSESQTQRPSHSIHVNPKYLEARQRLQQSTRAKETSSDNISGVVTPGVENAERSDRISISGRTRHWTEMPSKTPSIQRPQREHLNDTIHEKKGYRDVRDDEFPSELPRRSDIGVGRINEKVKQRDELDRPYYVSGNTASEMESSSNGFDVNKHGYGNYRASGLAQADRNLPAVHLNNVNKSTRPITKNWKNSEEEEYKWDDMNSKFTDYGGDNNSVKGGWNTDDADKLGTLQRSNWMPLETEQLDSQRNKLDTFARLKTSGGEDRVPLSRDIDEHLPPPRSQQDADSGKHMEASADALSLREAASGLHHTSSVWPQREPPFSVSWLNQMGSRVSSQSDGQPISVSGGLSTTSSSLPRHGLLAHSHPSSSGPITNILSGSSGAFGQQRHQPPSPHAHSTSSYVPLQHQKLHSSIDHDHPLHHSFSQIGQKPMQLPGHFNRAPHASGPLDSFSVLAQNENHNQQSHTLQNLHLPLSQPSQPSSAPFTQLRHHSPFMQQAHPDVQVQLAQTQQSHPIQTEKSPSLSSQSFRSHQSRGFSGATQSNNPVDISGQSSTSNLLAVIMKSGLLPDNQVSGLLNSNNIQPPLPSGPPPHQTLTSSAPPVTPSSSVMLPISQGNIPALAPSSMQAVLPPLPPGPPPPSSVLNTSSSQMSNTASAVANPLSSLLSSLVAKGIISSLPTELPAVTSGQMPVKLPNESSDITNTSPPVPSTSATSTIHQSSVTELSVSEPFALSAAALLQPSAATELENLIGTDFKPDIIRELHPLVISSVFDDLKHQCKTCGLRFKLDEQLQSHLDEHSSRKSEMSSLGKQTRRWYAHITCWIAGIQGLEPVQVSTTSLEELIPTSEKYEPMVPADESQCICALCGEPFEDFYSHGRDEWMYKGTVYLNLPEQKGDMASMGASMGQGPIVHAKCVSSSVDNMEGQTES